MIQKELEWVKNNIYNNSDGGVKGMKDIRDCQLFVATAPPPGNEGNTKFQQRKSYSSCFIMGWV